MPDFFSRRLESIPELHTLIDQAPEQFPFLLHSSAEGQLGRYSLLFMASEEVMWLDKDRTLQGVPEGITEQNDAFLETLKLWYQQVQADEDSDPRLPFIGGWFLYLGYELAAEIETKLELPQAQDHFPIAFAHRCKAAIIVQHDDEAAWLVAESSDLLEQLEQTTREYSGTTDTHSALPRLKALSSDHPAQFESAVERIHEYLLAGDVFQVNLSRGWRGIFEDTANPVSLYQALGQTNPAPFSGMAHWQGASLISSSPERLVETRGRQVQTRPIAGTRPRGGDLDSDTALHKELISHPKERAEHIMLIDLERNDLGRVCETGSVEVDELMVVESYAHVHHIVSNVRGTLREDAGPVDAISAVFPGGTITGCPKVRCMEIIAELEQQGRGFYTGSMGYLSRDGQMDLNILIRSMMLNGQDIQFRTGAGIVVDSIPFREVGETVDKAKGLLLALGHEWPEA